ncbi:MAG: DinB family protein [Planctomycetota bacterium]
MPTSDPVQILVTTNRWATENVIESCQTLSEEQFHQRFEMGPGNLHDTILHIIGAMRGWCDLLSQRDEPRPRLEADTKRSPDELLELLAEVSDEFESLALAHPVEEDVDGKRGKRTYTFNRGTVITHVTTHGMHHRAQCLNMLRHLGAETQPKSSVADWAMTVDGQGRK